MKKFFKKLFGWMSDFFERAAKTAIGVFVDKMKEEAIRVVRDAELAPGSMSGKEKYDYAFDKLKRRYPDAETAAINLAIELAVAIITEELKK